MSLASITTGAGLVNCV